MGVFKKKIKNIILKVFLNDLTAISGLDANISGQRGPEHAEWICFDLVDIVEEFVKENQLCDSVYVKSMNAIFKTERFELLLKKWSADYLLKLFGAMDDFSKAGLGNKEHLVLEDNPINRYAFKKFTLKFNVLPKIKWIKQKTGFSRIFTVLSQAVFVICLSLNSGVTFSGKKGRYKVMRESLWGLYPRGGHCFHDDFLVDEKSIKKEDLLLFSRKSIKASRQLNALCQEAKRSQFETFYLPSLKIGVRSLFSRVMPLYAVKGMRALSAEISSPNFSVFSSISRCFIYNALPYEKIFSNYEVGAELGHDFTTYNHIAEAIVCQNMKTKYYLMQISDLSHTNLKSAVAYLGCDKYFTLGSAHIRGSEGPAGIFIRSGYIFKRFIGNMRSRRKDICIEMGIDPGRKVVTFFDEVEPTKTLECEGMYRSSHSISFWEAALELALKEPAATVVMKPKELSRYDNLSSGLKSRFYSVRSKMEKLGNVHVVDADKWSFVECIGISDVVVTETMSSSATIAIICGVEGLYLDEAGTHHHPFTWKLPDKVVFRQRDKLIMTVRDILAGKISCLRMIPEDLLREFDEHPDDRGIDVLRAELTGKRP